MGRFAPRALDRFNCRTRRVTHYLAGAEDRNEVSKGMNVAGIYKDSRGYLWLGGWREAV